jgi:hypothetical protein
MSLFGKTWLGELRTIFTDNGARMILVEAAVLYSLFYPTPYRYEVPRKVPLAVVDQDRSDASRKLVRLVDAGEAARRETASGDGPGRRAGLAGRGSRRCPHHPHDSSGTCNAASKRPWDSMRTPAIFSFTDRRF